MTMISLSDAQACIKNLGADRRVRLSARHLNARLNVAMVDVISRVSKLKGGLEFHLFADNNFHVFMHGDYMGKFRMFEDKFVISGHNIRRARSAYGLGNNEELSSSERTIAQKMADNWTPLTYEYVRALGTLLINRMYLSGSPNYEHNKVDHHPIRMIIDTWASDMAQQLDLTPNSYSGIEGEDVLWNIMYHYALHNQPVKEDADWDEEPAERSQFQQIMNSFMAGPTLIDAVKEYKSRYFRRRNVRQKGYLLRLNRDGKINVMLSKPALKDDKSSVIKYDGVDGLVNYITDPTAVLVKERMVDGINAMNVAGHYRYVEGIGVRLTELPEAVIMRDEAETLTPAAMYWVDESFIQPLTAYCDLK